MIPGGGRAHTSVSVSARWLGLAGSGCLGLWSVVCGLYRCICVASVRVHVASVLYVYVYNA
eukprot:scaffold43506_cov33-Tisochrysis_lutea.AAC.1